MAESIINRVGRIISGSANAIVDAVENAAPEVIMEQAIREVDQAVDDVRVELGKAIAAKHLANKRLAEKNTKHEELAEKVEFAVSQSRDDLATAAISAQLDIEAQVPVLENTITQCSEKEKELEGYITALQAKKREMQEELRAFREVRSVRGEGAISGQPVNQNNVDKTIDKANSAFDRVLEKHVGLPGSKGVSMQNAAKLLELEKLAQDNRITERLAAIKSQKKAS
jgi:phage shock protein A